MAPAIKTGLKSATRIRPDGSSITYYYDRRTGASLGTDFEAASLEAITARKEGRSILVQRLSARIEDAPYDHRLALGDAGEWLVKAELVAAGLLVCTPNAGCAYDFLVDGGSRVWRVQVKTRAPKPGDPCTFRLFTKGGEGKPKPRNYHLNGIDILALVNWTDRACIFLDAMEAADKTSLTVMAARFAKLTSTADRWNVVTHEVSYKKATPDVAA